MKLGYIIHKNNSKRIKDVPQKIKNRTTIWCSNSNSGYLSEENENTNLKIYLHPMFIVALFTIAKIWKQPKYPLMDKWIKKTHTHTQTQTYTRTHTHNGILLSHKKNKILPFATMWMNFETTVPSKICQTKGQTLCDFNDMQNLKKQNKSKQNRNQVHRYKEKISGFHGVGV